jgi:hypothetical protein
VDEGGEGEDDEDSAQPSTSGSLAARMKRQVAAKRAPSGAASTSGDGAASALGDATNK